MEEESEDVNFFSVVILLILFIIIIILCNTVFADFLRWLFKIPELIKSILNFIMI